MEQSGQVCQKKYQTKSQDSIDSTPEPFLLEEWKELRGEIARKQASAERVILGAAVGNFTIMAFALKDTAIQGIFIALLPTVVSTISYAWFLAYLYSGFRISRYIQDQIEPKMPIVGWERWLSKLRSEHKIPIDPFGTICWAFYMLSLFTAVLKIILLNSHPFNIKIIFWQCTGVLGIWALWITLTHLIIVHRIRKRIRNLYESFR